MGRAVILNRSSYFRRRQIMKKRLVALLVAGAIIASMIPAVSAYADETVVPDYSQENCWCQIPDITKEIAQGWIIIPIDPHLMLFQFVPTENDYFRRMVLFQHDFDELFTERTGAPGYQHDFIIPLHNYSGNPFIIACSI